jgi:uncharacterized protein YndB with AHSA1/START domain
MPEARAVADVGERTLTATVQLVRPPERVFRALVSDEITAWWVRPGVFDTREWTADVRPGGAWRAAGIGGGRPYGLEGEFLEVEPPRRLVHTWHLVGTPAAPSTITYVLEPVDGGTWLTLRQAGIESRDGLMATAIGWETSFAALAELMGAESDAG